MLLARTKQAIPFVLISLLAATAYILTGGLAQPVHALPEYAARTGEACATCHVNPGGGGPRTLRGLIWSAKGRPDAVPELPGVLLAPGVQDGAELFEYACSACHGPNGEGLFGTAIANSGLSESKVRAAILRGRLRSGMPAFEGQFTDAQLDALVIFSQGLANGAVDLPPASYPLPAGELTCLSQTEPISCGGN